MQAKEERRKEIEEKHSSLIVDTEFCDISEMQQSVSILIKAKLNNTLYNQFNYGTEIRFRFNINECVFSGQNIFLQPVFHS